MDRQIRFDRTATVFELTALPLWMGLSFVALVGVLTYGQASNAAVFGWVAAKFVLTLVRTSDTARFRRDPQAAERLDHWTWRFAVLMVIDGLAWGAMVWLFMPTASPVVQMMLLAGVVGIASLGLFSTFGHKHLSIAFQLSVLVPMMLYYAVMGGRDGWGIVACGLIYQTVLIIEAIRAEARQVESLRLRYANAAIAEDRSLALAKAQHSDRAKSRFLAAVSHEIRTPLNGILGITQLLQTRPEAAPLKAELDVVRRSGQHLHRVIGDLLDISQVEHGRLKVQRSALVLVDTVRDVTELLQPVAQERELQLHVAFSPGLPKVVLADAARVKQVLHNLLGNALKYTPSGSVVLSVSAQTPSLRFLVRDTGPGIPGYQLDSIFEPFVQASASGQEARSERAAGGIGLGLAIARQLARAMGGDVTVQSTPGEGSTFTFEIHAPAVNMDPRLADPDAPEVPQFSGRVLVVDDNEVNSLVATGMLERMGLSVVAARDGVDALEAMRSGHFDAVLMDLQMPRLDGIEATRRWRAEERGPRLPIMALTANASAKDRESSLDAGMDGYLAKPFQIGQLADLLGDHLMPGREHALQPAHQPAHPTDKPPGFNQPGPSDGPKPVASQREAPVAPASSAPRQERSRQA